MKTFDEILKGGDLRSIGEANKVVKQVKNQDNFDFLFKGLFNSDRKIVMRTADALEKISISKPEFLKKHKNEILELCENARHIELKWHLALMISRLPLTEKETGRVWQLLTEWATDQKASRIVRVNSVQSLFNLLQNNIELNQDLKFTIDKILKENIPSLNARISKLKNFA